MSVTRVQPGDLPARDWEKPRHQVWKRALCCVSGCTEHQSSQEMGQGETQHLVSLNHKPLFVFDGLQAILSMHFQY